MNYRTRKCTYYRTADNAGVANAGVGNAGAMTYGKPSEQKTLRYQACMLKVSGLKRFLNDAHEYEQRPDVGYTSKQCTDSRFEQMNN